MNTVDLLIDSSVRLLVQAVDLLERLDERSYTAVAVAPHRVGGHVRHILEFYECFLDGLERGRIDYDARRRDAAVEAGTGAAMAKIGLLIGRLCGATALRSDPALLVRVEDGDGFLISSAGRELQVLCSHTIHHFALIALTLRVLGVPVDRGFGMAPSTLRHRAEAVLCAQ
jgi:hypothetical protein